jgi:hypothetical protein
LDSEGSSEYGRLSANILRYLLAILGLVVLLELILFTLTSAPPEDVAILHCYSRNLAETGAISYFPGGPPAEGATDFLWMLYIAASLKFHVSIEVATVVANVVSFVALGWILLKSAMVQIGAISLLAVIGGLSLFPPVQAAALGFSVLPFAFAIAATIIFLSRGLVARSAVSALLLCLLRPDGVVFAVPALLLLGILNGRARVHKIVVYSLVFVGLGLIYFLWRWRYFGHFMPLPFVVKANNERVFGLFIANNLWVGIPIGLLLVFTLGAMLGRRAFAGRNLRLILVLFVIPTAFYMNIRLEQDLDERFFIYVPVGIALMAALNWTEGLAWRSHPILLTAAALLLTLFANGSFRGYQMNRRARPVWARMRSLGIDLGSPPLRGTMLTTEAGLVPYHSRWAAYDSWGLNTPEFAYKVIQPEQVTSLHPDLAILHTLKKGNCALAIAPANDSRDWVAMTLNVKSGIAELGDYDTWQLPYWTPEGGDTLAGIGRNDELCVYLSRSYRARVEVERILARYGAKPLTRN